MRNIILLFFLILFSVPVMGVDNIYIFDDSDEKIILTNVYSEGVPTENATCNLTIFNPINDLNESFINLSVIMYNNGNGIYSFDITNNLSYNDKIYPLVLYCNDSNGFYGQDQRIGIKIGEKMYSFLIPGIVLLCIACVFFYLAFKIKENHEQLKLSSFYAGHFFVIISIFYARGISTYVPKGEWIVNLFNFMGIIYIFILLLFIYLQFGKEIKKAFDEALGLSK